MFSKPTLKLATIAFVSMLTALLTADNALAERRRFCAIGTSGFSSNGAPINPGPIRRVGRALFPRLASRLDARRAFSSRGSSGAGGQQFSGQERSQGASSKAIPAPTLASPNKSAAPAPAQSQPKANVTATSNPKPRQSSGSEKKPSGQLVPGTATTYISPKSNGYGFVLDTTSPTGQVSLADFEKAKAYAQGKAQYTPRPLERETSGAKGTGLKTTASIMVTPGEADRYFDVHGKEYSPGTKPQEIQHGETLHWTTKQVFDSEKGQMVSKPILLGGRVGTVDKDGWDIDSPTRKPGGSIFNGSGIRGLNED